MAESDRKTFYLDGSKRNVAITPGLWDALEEAIKNDKLSRFTNRSDCIRYYVTKFVEEVEEQKK